MPCRARTQRRGQAWNPWPGRSGAAWPCPCCGTRASRPLCHVADLRRRTSGPPLAGGTPALPGRRSLFPGGTHRFPETPKTRGTACQAKPRQALACEVFDKTTKIFFRQPTFGSGHAGSGRCSARTRRFSLGPPYKLRPSTEQCRDRPPGRFKTAHSFPPRSKSCCASPPVAKRPDAGAAGTAHHRAPCPGRRPADASTRNPRRRRFRSLA